MKCTFCGREVETEMDHYDVCLSDEETIKHRMLIKQREEKEKDSGATR